jgi:hypothetical protein
MKINKEIVRLHKEKKTYPQIAGILGMSETTVARHVQAYKKMDKTRREVLAKNLEAARKALAEKRIKPVIIKPSSTTIPAPRPYRPPTRIHPSQDATVRELASVAHTLGLELHIQFVEKK